MDTNAQDRRIGRMPSPNGGEITVGAPPHAKVLAACLLVVLTGGLLAAWATSLPTHIDLQAAAEIANNPETMGGTCAEYTLADERMRPLRTMKWPIFDFGFGIMLAGGILFLAVAAFRIGTWSDIGKLPTPRSPLQHVLLATFLWISLVVSSCTDVMQWIARDDIVSSQCDADFRSLPLNFILGIALTPLAALFSWLRTRRATFPKRLENLRISFSLSGADRHPGDLSPYRRDPRFLDHSFPDALALSEAVASSGPARSPCRVR
jgi:hypothetical protein